MARNKPKRISWIYRSVFLIVFLTISVGGAVVLGALLATLEDLPTIEELRDYTPQDSTFVYDADEKVTLAEFSRQRRYVLTLNQIPKQLVNCFLAIEDKRFYDHFGVDPIGVARAAVTNFQSRGWSQGASTISMQLPGNVLDLVDRRDISLKRKFMESLLALQIERRYSKDQILELYLNQIYMGGGAYGVEAAAKTYFGKTVSELTLSECAAIAGLPAAPSMINPLVNPDKCVKRRNIVLEAMKEAGFISVFECSSAQREELEVRRYSKNIAPFQAPYFVDYAREAILKTPDFVPEALRGKIPPSEFLDTGGLKVVTTLDMTLQKIAEKAMRKGLIDAEAEWHRGKAERRAMDPEESGPPLEGRDRIGRIAQIGEEDVFVQIEDFSGTVPRPKELPFYNPDLVFGVGELLDVKVDKVDYEKKTFTGQMIPDNKIKGAMVVLEATTGRVLALVGGDNYYDQSENKAEWNYATQGGRQPGSGIKPLFYSAAVSKGFRPCDTYLNVPFYIGGYQGKNYDKTHERRMMTLQEGLERSQNVMMLRVAQDAGFADSAKFVQEFDFAWPEPQWKVPLGQAAICLGTFDVTPLELAAAYIPFANEGVAVRPYGVERVVDRYGETVYQARPPKKMVLDPLDAYLVVSMMRGVFGPRGTASGIGYELKDIQGMPEIAGKTGTTTKCRDAWLTACTPDLVVSTVIGFDPPRSLGWKMTGGRVAGPVVQEFFKEALPTRQDWTKKFPRPHGTATKDICLYTGKLHTQKCNYNDYSGVGHEDMVFRKGTEPAEDCNGVHYTPSYLLTAEDSSF